jgi:hypothetical protein
VFVAVRKVEFDLLEKRFVELAKPQTKQGKMDKGIFLLSLFLPFLAPRGFKYDCLNLILSLQQRFSNTFFGHS